ncbi:putative serine-type carboxypeptidase F [Mollisia scopiformis]|uniref:Carboxypeptidase n=1 Tax=Mollisia scopiformis TaxID=149040 RepID=A0A132B9D4_MOLSC|nr:putative serine-type carboxypeptidase F [Mollisia scopiformis]KUJ08287.1 putative serine-type carboxypeptidase F [Mollisia scopiformis]
MSARMMRSFVALLVFCTFISAVCAGKMEDVIHQRGYNAKLLKKKDANAAKPKPNPIVKRASATSSVCTPVSTPNPTAPPSCGGNNCANEFNKQFTASLDNLESFCSSWTAEESAVFAPTGTADWATNCLGTSTDATAVASKVSSACSCFVPEPTTCSDDSGFRFLNDNTKPFQVTSLPEVNFDIGEMYSGNIPIDEDDPSRALFFVFQPTDSGPVDEVLIWLNGGPGCSSLEGFFQENGRFIWSWGQPQVTINPYSWVNLTNVLWVEQPVGTGFAIGNVTATGEEDIAQDFVKFFLNFQNIFGISNFKIFVTGESYAGRYVPYISAAMLDQNDTTHFNVSGALMYDPCIGDCSFIAEEVPAYPFVEYNNNMIGLNASYLAQLKAADETCGYAAYRDQYLVFPAAGVQPPVPDYSSECDINNLATNAAFKLNPCFNSYEIVTQCPMPADPLGFPTDLAFAYPALTPLYFDREDVKIAMHAPLDVDWVECSGPVFLNNNHDTSVDAIQHVLPQVIEATNRVLIANGQLDFVVITAGTQLSIQNMTWNGKLGFEVEPSTPIVITLPDLLYQQAFVENGYEFGFEDPQGTMGVQHYERGLMWAETYLSGHMQPQFQPRSSYRHVQWLLGHIDEL